MGLIYTIEYMLDWIYYYLGWDNHPAEIKSLTYYFEDEVKVESRNTFGKKNARYFGYSHVMDSSDYEIVLAVPG
jgi:hypothetical protein